MKNFCLLILGILLYPYTMDASTTRIRQNFDFDWLFHLGDESAIANPEFSSKDWKFESVQLPHDWSVGLDFTKEAGAASGYLPGGIGWYRKEFEVGRQLKGKRVSVVFDGIYHKASVYLNGEKIAYHRYGYTSFEVDLTPYILYGRKNVICVRVDHAEKSRWYTGSGIYRHAWLQITDPVHVKMWGTYITTPKITQTSASVSCTTTVNNASAQPVKIEVVQYLLDNEGRRMKSGGKKYAARALMQLNADEVKDIKQSFEIARPKLWDIAHPYRYGLETVIRKNGKTVDNYQTRFGIRTIHFDAAKGFSLNGRNMKLQGVCLHQDAGCLGAGVPDRSYERRLTILKEFGINAVRCSHNPPSPEFLNYCDSIGLLVIDEAFDKWKSGYYEQFFEECWQQDISDMVVRDRNHPSVILWSIGNELSEAKRKDNVGVERATMLRDFVHKIEPTRLTMLALQPEYKDEFASVTDVVGYNYGELSYIEDKKKHPERIGLVSEAYPYYSCMRPYVSRDYSSKNPWNYVAENDYFCGSFLWAGVDYTGESMGWPSKGWAATLFDMCMYEKPRAAYFRSVWNEKPVVKMAVVDYSIDEDPGKDHWQAPPMIHDWTFPYTDARVLPVFTPSNCDEVCLIDPRGVKYGPRKPKDYLNNTIVWNQPYRPGKMIAIGYKDGKEVCRDTIQTSKRKAVKYTLVPDRATIKADGQDLAFIDLQLLDEDGVKVSVNDRLVAAEVEGAGRLMGIDSGEMRRVHRFNSHELPTFQGRCTLVVQAGRNKGIMNVKVQVEGLPDQVIIINVN